jgi:hypothetical protein
MSEVVRELTRELQTELVGFAVGPEPRADFDLGVVVIYTVDLC